MASSVKIILGSQSPRRLEILSYAGYEVEVVKPLVEEVFPDSMDIYQVPEFLSRLKMDD
ncbi:MAG: Maf family protein, partial [Chitinophagales bacterium]|nr:Maf family protein [Chitinophagales bacterium]